MIFLNRRKTNRNSCIFVLSCIISGCCVPFLIFSLTYSPPPVFVPENSDNDIIDRQDEWQYQNSITGEWYYWRSIYKKQHNDTESRVKWLNIPPTSSLGVILSRLLSNNPRPVVIFHEGDLGGNDIQQSLAQIIGSQTPLGFERIKFFMNSKAPWLLPRKSDSKYLDMCRFFTLMLPNHPLLTLFSFYWRLDAHSYIFAPQHIKHPFEIMQKRQIQYAFIMVNDELPLYATGLWSLFHKFINRHSIKPSAALRETQTDVNGAYSHFIIFTNFTIANVSFFRDHPLIRAWLHTVDRDGGIYRHRWGDAPVHTLAISQFLPREQILRLRYFGYLHRREYVCASGVDGDLCKEQIKPFTTLFQNTYINYEDGCWPSTRNPLCHYYPELRL